MIVAIVMHLAAGCLQVDKETGVQTQIPSSGIETAVPGEEHALYPVCLSIGYDPIGSIQH